MDDAPLIDPQSTYLEISYRSTLPSDQDGWRTLGECIGNHENLRELDFYSINYGSLNNTSTHENLEALLTGVNQNRTLRKLRFYSCHGEWPLENLAALFTNNQNLSLLKVWDCCDGITTSLSAVLRSCTSRSLECISCRGAQVGDEGISEFIEALAGLPQLKKLKLKECVIGHRGCVAVAALLRRPACMLQDIYLGRMDCSTAALQSFSSVLRSPTCMLKNLHLHNTDFEDDVMISFADALTTNRRLEKLCLDDGCSISFFWFDAVQRALCNKSNIGDVIRSNHTLQSLGCDPMMMPRRLRTYLDMNKREDKSLVVREKILMNFFKGNFSMEPFHENKMPANTLPHLLAWFGRTPDEKSFAALFNFLRRMPPLSGNSCPVLKASGRKRKVRS